MPEGPTLVILKEILLPFKGKKIIKAGGNAKIDIASLEGEKIIDIKTWGKVLFICLAKQVVRIHLLMFGSYSINEQTKPDKSLRLSLIFSKGAVYFYTCSVKTIESPPDELYDTEADIMSVQWNPQKARKKIKQMPDIMVCDALLDQQLFSGVGNIIKNEVLFRIKLHPESILGKMPAAKITQLIKETRNYSFDFLQWKKEFELKKHWLAYTKKTCPRCKILFTRKYCGKTKRRTFFCENCQVKYGEE